MPWLSAGVAEYAPENHWLESHPSGRSVVSDMSRRLRTRGEIGRLRQVGDGTQVPCMQTLRSAMKGRKRVRIQSCRSKLALGYPDFLLLDRRLPIFSPIPDVMPSVAGYQWSLKIRYSQ